VRVIVSLLEAHEVHELGLQDEAAHTLGHGMGFLSFPIADRSVPGGFAGVRALARTIVSESGGDGGVVVHCRAGIGRSSLIAACALAMCGTEADDAFRMLSAARGVEVPDTEGQRLWVSDFGAWVRETGVVEL
jgi:protein-tyrosine phosphatase